MRWIQSIKFSHSYKNQSKKGTLFHHHCSQILILYINKKQTGMRESHAIFGIWPLERVRNTLLALTATTLIFAILCIFISWKLIVPKLVQAFPLRIIFLLGEDFVLGVGLLLYRTKITFSYFVGAYILWKLIVHNWVEHFSCA